MYIQSKPIGKVKTIDLDVAIRLERNRIFDIYFDTDEMPNDARLQEMYALRASGASCWHEPNF